MREHGRFEKYVISRRTDGKFKMNFIYAFDKEESAICELKVCRWCLSRISYRGYSHMGDKRREEIYGAFSLTEYFATYPTDLVTMLPSRTDDTAH